MLKTTNKKEIKETLQELMKLITRLNALTAQLTDTKAGSARFFKDTKHTENAELKSILDTVLLLAVQILAKYQSLLDDDNTTTNTTTNTR